MTNFLLQDSEKFPRFLRILFIVEMWERFSYYGMRALLVLFLTSHLGFADTKAYAIYSLFAAISYAGPVIGGLIADKLLGFRKMVIIGGIVITIGHVMLTFIKLNSDLIYLGLAFVAIGAGLFKGNITNLLGSCYSKDDDKRSQGFTLFYVSVNLGSLIAYLLCGYVADRFGWHYGFGLAGIGMIFGLGIFVRYEKELGNNGLPPVSNLAEKRFLGLSPSIITFIIACITSYIISLMLKSSEEYANLLMYFGILIVFSWTYIIIKEPSNQRNGLLTLTIFIIFLMLFFALEMQLGSLINLFTDRNINKEILGFSISASMFQALNPLSIIILGFIIGSYAKLDKRYDIARFALGISTMAICFFILYIGCLNANINGQVSVSYLIVALFCMGLGEICMAPFVQSQATLLAPPKLKGFIMGILMLSLAFSNLAGVIISKFMSVPTINGEVNPIESLAIYKAGFLDIAKFNLLFFCVFIILIPFIKRMGKQIEDGER